MRAIVIHQFGDPKNLRVEEVAAPEPKESEALVEVRSAGINPSDLKNMEGKMHGTTLPRIPGRDFTGVVARGPSQWIGREVWGTGGDIGFTRDGSHAQYILLPVAALTPLPAGLSLDAAGSAGLVYVTAFSAMVTAAGVSQKDIALIIGAGGGVGSAAVQIAKSRGAKVIGAVRLDEDIARARENGADEVINTRNSNLADAIGSMTGERGADIVFDSSGYVFADAIESAAMGARVSVISAPPDGQATFNLRNVYRKELSIRGVDTRRLDAVACAGLLAQMREGFESGRLKVNVGQAFPLSSAPEAYERAGKGEGRIYLKPD